MSKNTDEIKKRILKLKEQHTTAGFSGNRKKLVYHFKHFSTEIREQFKNRFSSIKKLALVSVLLMSPNLVQKASSAPNYNKTTFTLSTPETTIDIAQQVDKQMDSLWEKMNHNIDALQKSITRAKKSGQRRSAVKGIFQTICPTARFSGAENYCVAGSMYVHKQCGDSIMNAILPSAEDLSSYKFGNPLSSCDAAMTYFRQTLGNRYASRGSKNFNTVVNNLKPGDIIFVSSRTNTSSGKHCVTVSGTKKSNGKIAVRSFNNESNYEVSINSIVGAANIMDEYCHRLENTYAATNEATIPTIQFTAQNAQDSTTQNTDETNLALADTNRLALRDSNNQSVPRFVEDAHKHTTNDINIPAFLLHKDRSY